MIWSQGASIWLRISSEQPALRPSPAYCSCHRAEENAHNRGSGEGTERQRRERYLLLRIWIASASLSENANGSSIPPGQRSRARPCDCPLFSDRTRASIRPGQAHKLIHASAERALPTLCTLLICIDTQDTLPVLIWPCVLAVLSQGERPLSTFRYQSPGAAAGVSIVPADLCTLCPSKGGCWPWI